MVIARGAPMLVGNQVKGSVVILHDISEIKQLTEKLVDAQKRIRELSAKYTLEDIVGDSEVMLQAKQQLTASWRGLGQKIALVPTMGWFHAGHLALEHPTRRCTPARVNGEGPSTFGSDPSRHPSTRRDSDCRRTDEVMLEGKCFIDDIHFVDMHLNTSSCKDVGNLS